MSDALHGEWVSLLKAVERQGRFMARCPAHEDRNPSLSVGHGHDGRVVLHCFAGCTVPAIVAAVGRRIPDLFPDSGNLHRLPPVDHSTLRQPEPPPDDSRQWPIVATYDYTDADGTILFQAVRKEPDHQNGTRRKAFLQRRPNGKGGWLIGSGDQPAPLYRLPELLEALAAERAILLVEGEKDADRAWTMGFPATTNPRGAQAWRPDMARTLAGGHVIVLPDNDEPGRLWAQAVGQSCHEAGCRVEMLALPGLPPKGDLSDWLDDGERSYKDLAHQVTKARPWAPGNPIPTAEPSRFTVLSVADLAALPIPAWLVNGVLIENTLAMLFGAPGAGKSFVSLDLALRIATGSAWFGRETERGAVLYLAGEGVTGFAQRVGAWVRAWQPADTAGFGFVAEAPDLTKPADVDHVLRALDRLHDTPRLVVVDTLSRAMVGANENAQDAMSSAVEHAERIRRLSGAAVLLLHHPRKDSDVARGSGVLAAACDTIALCKDDAEGRVLLCEKSKDAPSFDPILFTLYAVPPSCVAIPTPADSGDRLPAQQYRALSALGDCPDGAATHGEWATALPNMPASTFNKCAAALLTAKFVQKSDKPRAPYHVSDIGWRLLKRAV